jgi:tryptophan-rich sensory protein
MILNNLHDWILFLIPIVAIFVTSGVCKIGRNAGVTVKFRPPPAVFGIAWACLTLLIGLSWIFCVKDTHDAEKITAYVIYTLLITSLMLWIIFYGCASSPLKALWTLIPSLALSFMVLSLGTYASRLLICPLIAWIIFAMMMATHEYQQVQN